MNNFARIAPLALIGLAACASDVQTIDRTQPNAIDKQMLEGIWYHRATIVESGADALGVEGIAGDMEKIRWDIQEDRLIAYRSYERVPFAEGLTDEGRDFFGSPVAAFRIESHFDIQREYNATTGVPTNVLSENTTDRPWHQRRFMRIDWSQNTVGQATRFGFGALNGILSGAAETSFFVQGDEAQNPDRPIITEDYFDVTNLYALEPSPSFCLFQLLFNSVPRCGIAEVKTRLSFRKVDPTDDYEALYYPDRLEYRNDDGEPLILDDRDVECNAIDAPARCEFRGFNFDGRFGNFRINRVAFDRERFQTRAGRIFLAGRYDLWQDSFDSTGALIPYEQREPQPVIYYTNPKTPRNILEGSETMAGWWAEPFNEAVAYRMGYVNENGNQPDLEAWRSAMCTNAGIDMATSPEACTPDVYDMFQHRVNDCSKDNVIAYAERNDMTSIIDEIAGGNEGILAGNVERICASMQFEGLQRGMTLDPSVAERTGRQLAFTWQRLGDLRYSFNNYVIQLSNGPWGVAQFGQDPETGEFVANIANYFSDAGDRISQSGVDIIQYLNGDLRAEDIIRGNVTREFSTRVARDFHVSQELKDGLAADARASGEVGGGAAASGVDGDSSNSGRLLTDKEKYEAMFAHSDLEREFLLSEDMVRVLAGPGLYQPNDGFALPAGSVGNLGDVIPGIISDEALEAASPVNWMFDMENNPVEQAIFELGSNGFDMAEFFDPNVSPLATELTGRPRDEIFTFLQTELFKAVQGHEVGHAIGLRHNFEASMDPLNYRPEFWENFYTQGDQGRPSPEQPIRTNEYKYASIMDYAFDFTINGWHGIGSYDAAAIRFMYGQLVDVWDDSQVSIPDARQYGSYVQRCGKVDDNPDFGDEGGDFARFFYLEDPENIPRLLSFTPGDYADENISPETIEACQRGDIDIARDDACDTVLDREFRVLAQAAEANSNALGFPNICIVFGDDQQNVRDVINAVQSPRTDLIYGARVMATVEELIQQETAAFAGSPEIDDPLTPITGDLDAPCVEGDESRDCVDDDGDGVADDKGYDYASWKHEVPYKYCSDLFAGFSNPFCQRWDTGWDFQESVESQIVRYDRDYLWRSFQRDRSNFGNPVPLLIRLVFRRFKLFSDVYQYFVFTSTADDTIGRFNDWEEAAYLGANFLERVLQSPEPGTYCLGADNVYRNQALLPEGETCSEPYETAVGFGGGAFLEDSWNEEYYFNTTVLGTFWDKWAAMFVMTRSSGFFAFDLSQIFDRRAFQLPYLRTWQDPFLQRWSSLIREDWDGYRSRIVPEDPNDPTSEPIVRYTPMFDEIFDDSRGDLAGSSVRRYLRDNDFPTIEPSWSYDLRLWALTFALSNWSSLADYSVDYFRLSKVTIPGLPDETEFSDDIEVVRFIDPETRLEYAAPKIEPFREPNVTGLINRSYYGNNFDKREGRFHEWSVGAELLEDLNRMKDQEYDPLRQSCVDSAPNVPPELATTPECTAFERVRTELADEVGFVNMLRKFSVRAEGIY
ncbi:MAG: zinc-dependent metalloprotease [Myxococcota bacterium]